MPLNEYWECDPLVYGAYRQSYKIKQEAENYKAWLMGRYVYDAIGSLAPILRPNMTGQTVKAQAYLAEPYPVTQEDLERRKEEKAKKNMETMRARFMAFAQEHNNKEGGATDGNE